MKHTRTVTRRATRFAAGAVATIALGTTATPFAFAQDEAVDPTPVPTATSSDPTAGASDPELAAELELIGATNVSMGQEITIAGTGFTPGESVSLLLGEAPLGLATVDDDGAVIFQVAVSEAAGFTVGANVLQAGDASVSVPVIASTLKLVGTPSWTHGLTLRGAGFVPGERVVLTAAGQSLGVDPVADVDGAFEVHMDADVDVFSSAKAVTVTATGQASAADLDVQIDAPKASISYESGAEGKVWPGQGLEVTWKGLRPGESVVARLQVEPVPGDPIRQLDRVSGKVDEDGTFTYTFTTDASMEPGQLYVALVSTVTSETTKLTGPKLQAPGKLAASFQESPRTVRLAGRGFEPGVEVSMREKVTGSTFNATPDADGGFELLLSTDLFTELDPAGDYTFVSALADGGASVVISARPAPPVTGPTPAPTVPGVPATPPPATVPDTSGDTPGVVPAPAETVPAEESQDGAAVGRPVAITEAGVGPQRQTFVTAPWDDANQWQNSLQTDTTVTEPEEDKTTGATPSSSSTPTASQTTWPRESKSDVSTTSRRGSVWMWTLVPAAGIGVGGAGWLMVAGKKRREAEEDRAIDDEESLLPLS